MVNSFFVDALAGMTGGLTSALVGQPLDTIKTKMINFPKTYTCTSVCVSKITRQQGFRGLYAGTSRQIMYECVNKTLTFSAFGRCQRIVARVCEPSEEPTKLSSMENALAGSITPLFTSLVLCPVELVNLRMLCFGVNPMVKQSNPSVNHVVRAIWKANGFKGLFRGLGSTMARESLGCSVLFGSYEWTRGLLKPKDKRKEDCGVLATVIAGSVAGLFTGLVTHPIDEIKCRVQMSERSSEFQLIREVIRNGGFRGLYNSLCSTLMKTIPVTGVLLLSVELTRSVFQNS